MKTFRQKLNLWLEEKKNQVENEESKDILEEVQRYIKSQETEEEHMVNSSYHNGYYDRELNKGFRGSYYKDMYKTHDFLKRLTKQI